MPVSEQVTVAVPQASVAVGEGTFAQVGTVGLQPRSTVAGGQPESTGGVVSIVQVYTVEQDAVLLHASVAVQVIVLVLRHPVIVIPVSEQVTVGVPQASVAVGEGTLAQVGIVAGLQPKFTVGGGQPESIGGAVSTVQV